MQHPKIKFEIDVKKDVNTFFDFSTDAEFDGGRNLKWAILDKYPVLEKYFKGLVFVGEKSFIDLFVQEQYEKNKKIMEENLKAAEKDWQKIEESFYRLTDRLFSSSVWPEGKYIAYSTICGMYPRFLEDKTFQIPFNPKDKKCVNMIIAHEMLHFIFYDYFLEKYPEYKAEDMFAWHVSEIFNVIIQNLPEWLEVFEIPAMAYPEHEKIIAEIQKECKTDWNLNELTEKIIEKMGRFDLAG